MARKEWMKSGEDWDGGWKRGRGGVYKIEQSMNADLETSLHHNFCIQHPFHVNFTYLQVAWVWLFYDFGKNNEQNMTFMNPRMKLKMWKFTSKKHKTFQTM